MGQVVVEQTPDRLPDRHLLRIAVGRAGVYFKRPTGHVCRSQVTLGRVFKAIDMRREWAQDVDGPGGSSMDRAGLMWFCPPQTAQPGKVVRGGR